MQLVPDAISQDVLVLPDKADVAVGQVGARVLQNNDRRVLQQSNNGAGFPREHMMGCTLQDACLTGVEAQPT